jgi:hypothetical protein
LVRKARALIALGALTAALTAAEPVRAGCAIRFVDNRDQP